MLITTAGRFKQRSAAASVHCPGRFKVKYRYVSKWYRFKLKLNTARFVNLKYRFMRVKDRFVKYRRSF